MMKRVRLTPTERAAMLARQGGCCVSWGCTETRGLIEEHSTPHTWTGAKADQLMCTTCHKAKTKLDAGRIAKTRRLAHGKTQADKRAAKGSKMRSRGFDKRLRKKMDGSVEPRR